MKILARASLFIEEGLIPCRGWAAYLKRASANTLIARESFPI
jgi:hypothetical protein